MSCALNKTQMARIESRKSMTRSGSRRSMGMLERALSSFSLVHGEKKVHFRKRSNRVHKGINLKDYTDGEVAAYWYGRDDYDRMRRNRARAEKRLREEGALMPGDDEYACDLETDTDAALRVSTLRESIRSVMLEQKRQLKEDDHDNNVATGLFLNTSFAAHVDARERARDLESTTKVFVLSGRRWAPTPSKRPSLQKQISFRLRRRAPPMQPIRMDSFYNKKKSEFQPPKLPTREGSFAASHP